MNKVYNIPVELNEKRQEQMSGLEALHRLANRMGDEERDYYMFVNGEMRFVDYTTRFLALSFVSVCLGFKYSFDDAVKIERGMYCRSLFEKGRKAEVLSVFTAYPSLVYPGEEKLLSDLEKEVALEQAAPENPSPDREEEEPETVSNAEEASADAEAAPEEPETVSNAEEASADAEAASEEEPETLIPIIDADGVRRMATLDEVEEMREAAQGIYAGEPPEPDFVSDDDFLSSFPSPAPLGFWSRRNAMKYVYRFDCHGQRFYVCARSLPDAYKRISRFEPDESLSFLGIMSGYRPPCCRKALRRVFSRVRFAWGKCERKGDFPKPYSYDAESWSVSPILIGSQYRRYRSVLPVD